MRNILPITAMLVALSASQVFAGDQVPSNALDALGLGDMQVVSDAEGMQVRGKSSSAMSMGLSLITGLLVDPDTKSFIFGSDVNAASATAENAGKNIISMVSHSQSSALNLELNILTATSVFTGSLIGGAGGMGMASGN